MTTPSSTHLMGTNVGGDIFSGVVYGARVAAAAGFGAVAISTLGTLIVGVTIDSFGGAADAIIQRFVDSVMALPGLVRLLAIVTITGSGLASGAVASRGGNRVRRGQTIAVGSSSRPSATRP